MDILKTIYIAIYAILGLIVAYYLIRLLISLKKMMLQVEGISEGTERISDNVDSLETKLNVIRNSADSWKFFAALYIVFRIIRETLRYARKDGLGKSFSKACIRNVRKVSSIKL